MIVKHGTVIDGKYEIQREIGRGGMSVVYLAMDNRLNKLWAVKVLQRHGIDKNNEIVINSVPDDTELMKKLDHPSIPRIVDIIDKPDEPQIYIVMDYIEGESLDKILDEFGAQPQDMVIEWAKQICDTLKYLHSQKPPIIYRDMKPANIMLSPNGNIKLIDFGIAREYKEQNLADTTSFGTKGYASPEHFGGRTDARSDIYTLGMTMHHLITGMDPRVKGYEYIPIREYNPELSDGLEYIINKCTAIDPENRYQNCSELIYDLDNYELLTKDFKKKQKRKLSTFIISACLAVVFALTGAAVTYVADREQNNNYQAKIDIGNMEYDDAIVSINEAIKIDKKNIQAYEALLEYINKDNNISDKELYDFKNLYISLRNTYLKHDDKDSQYNFDEEFVNFSYEAGIYTLASYDSLDISGSAKEAHEFFKDIKDLELEISKLAACFYTICDFYKEDNNTQDSIDYKEKYSQLFEAINKGIEYLDSFETLDISHDKKANLFRSIMYRVSLNVISGKKDEISNEEYCNVDKEIVMDLLKNIKSKSEQIYNIDSKTKRDSAENCKYVLDNIDDVIEDLEFQYNNN